MHLLHRNLVFLKHTMLELLRGEIVKGGVQGWGVDLVEKLEELIDVPGICALSLLGE